MKSYIIAFVLLSAGCTNVLEIDPDDFARLPAVDSLRYANVVPAQTNDYWELRFAFEQQPPRILGAGGRLTRDQLDPALRAALDTTRARSGFHISCLPGFCYKYIAAVNGAMQLFASPQALADFLGPIDVMEEAALLAHAHGVYWDHHSPDAGYREVAGGWQIVGLQLVAFCAPVQTDRVLLLVRRNGTIQELDREVYRRDNNVCI